MFLDNQDGYTVTIPIYEGPLDLLLNLIEHAELDITRVAIAQVTDQFLAYIRQLQVVSPDEVSEFLVIAAKLVQIKSEALLPRPPDREEGEEDPGEALARQLRIYKRFKDIAGWLGERDVKGLRTYVRLAAPPKTESRYDLEGISLADLVEAAERAFNREEPAEDVGNIITPQRVTIRGRIVKIIGELRNFGRSRFTALVSDRTNRIELVVTFLAVLELVKRRKIVALQDDLFSEIEITPGDGQDFTDEASILEGIDLEFGE